MVRERPLPLRFKDLLIQIAILLASLIGVLVGAKYTVESAVRIAELYEIAKSVIGATIIAVGTSLPELAIGLAALRRGNIDLAMGNVVGSCLTNMTLILGMSLIVSPLVIRIEVFQTLILFLLMTNLIMWFFFERGKVNFLGGLTFLTLYQVCIITILGIQIAIP